MHINYGSVYFNYSPNVLQYRMLLLVIILAHPIIWLRIHTRYRYQSCYQNSCCLSKLVHSKYFNWNVWYLVRKDEITLDETSAYFSHPQLTLYISCIHWCRYCRCKTINNISCKKGRKYYFFLKSFFIDRNSLICK